MKYSVIYADPPWKYNFSKSNSRKIENQYPTMKTEEICSLDIPSTDDSVLYLWATAPKLLDALQVMKAWGFKYKTHAVWDKEILGMGYWFRGQHELLLVGVKGHFSPPKQSLRIGSIWREKRTKHSKKPLGIKDIISKWYPTYSKIELFSRQKTDGWDVFGDEVGNSIILEYT